MPFYFSGVRFPDKNLGCAGYVKPNIKSPES